MEITRHTIITTMQKSLSAQPNILALWLEGADATGFVDEFSDIDLCCSVRQGNLELAAAWAQAALESLGELDLVEIEKKGEDFLSNTFHLQGSSPYLLVDFDVFVGRGSTFTTGDAIERPLILFDRAGVIQLLPVDEQVNAANQAERLKELADITAQYSRVEKYVRRGDFLEAFGYYHKWLLLPLIEVLRMRYTPLHPDYYIIHISRHLPTDVLRRVEDLFKVTTLADIEIKSRIALTWIKETAEFLRHRDPDR